MSNSKQYNVVKALFDSYLTFSFPQWGQKKEFSPDTIDAKKYPAASTKIAIVKELAEGMPTFDYQTEQWIKFIHLLDEKERPQVTAKEKTLSGPAGLNLVRLFAVTTGGFIIKTDSLLANTLHAIRSYLVEALAQNEDTKKELEDKQNKLSAELTIEENKLKVTKATSGAKASTIEERERERTIVENKYTALVGSAAAKYHETFFNNVLKTNDARTDLPEKTFADYCKNADKGVRKTTNLTKLCPSIPEESAATRRAAANSPSRPPTLYATKANQAPRPQRKAAAKDSNLAGFSYSSKYN